MNRVSNGTVTGYRIALLLVFLMPSAARGQALAVQDRPDFSGRWILASADPPGPEISKAMTVRQSLARTNVRGEPMTPFYKEIAIDRELESGTRSETHQIGIQGGVVGGVVGSHRPGGPPSRPRGLFAVKWDDAVLVFEQGTYSGETSQSGPWTQRREEWSLEPDGRLRVAITTRGSSDTARTVTLVYRRPPPPLLPEKQAARARLAERIDDERQRDEAAVECERPAPGVASIQPEGLAR